MNAIRKYENPAPTVEVLYMCEKDNSHISPIKFHAQVTDFPRTWDCSHCHQPAKYIASANTPTDEVIPDPNKAYDISTEEPNDDGVFEDYSHIKLDGYTNAHLQALHERRTVKELENLLESRLTLLRESGKSGF